MAPKDVNAQSEDWSDALLTGNEPSVCDIAIVVFGLPSSKDRLEE